MVHSIYIIILIYFLLGGIGFYLINNKKDPKVARESYTKYMVYFFIINILFFSITINPEVFHYLTILIVGVGLFEMARLFYLDAFKQKGLFVFSLAAYVVLSFGFYKFGLLNKGLVLFTFLILSIFDSFSQISGQLWGHKKLLPKISPGKTMGGLVGGTIVALGSSLFLNALCEWYPTGRALFMAAGIVMFALIGDLSASLYKRKFKVKDFSKLIPGHGGFLDRFDSLISGGAWVAFWVYFLN